jgi:hypothetical protein
VRTLSNPSYSRTGLAGLVCLSLAVVASGCGEPSPRELKNRQEFEALLTAISLRNTSELEKDATRIDQRHNSGELTDPPYTDLQAIISLARSGKWDQAERQAYDFRERQPYFQ